MNAGSLRWFLTGASAGFGRTIAEAALARGDAVVATARTPAALDDLVSTAPDRVLALPLDVTDPDQVRTAAATAVATGGVDVLVNNAGHGLVGAVEELTDADLRALLEVNVLGPMALTRALLPHLRERGAGHIVQMSSVGGVIGNPGHAAYAMTKFALEGLSEALAGEVAPFGIRVTIVEPGPFRTGFAGRSMRFAAPNPAYAGTPAGLLRGRMGEQDGNQPGDPVRAATTIVDWVHGGLGGEHVPLRLPLGENAVRRIGVRLRERLAELDRVADLARSTDYGAARTDPTGTAATAQA
jgi:NAD(P)-dependent dehydrogenase (short-subunit alcohol dehydrogenase family)